MEAVIAIAIFSMGAMALYSAVNTNLVSLARVDAINTRASALESAVDFMSTIDPVLMPQGRVQLGDVTVVWQAATTAYQGDVLDAQRVVSINQASLMDTLVSLYRQDDLIAEFKLTLLGVERVRGGRSDLFN